jgi:hypothetical protein
MSTQADPPARRALALAASTGACLVAALDLANDVQVAPDVSALIAPVVDLGADQ